MIDVDIVALVVVLIGAFASGLIDAVVGGGGLLLMPVLIILFPQASHVHLIASTKTASMFGSIAAARQYAKQIHLKWQYLIWMGLIAALASVTGTLILKSVPTVYFKIGLWCIICFLLVYTSFSRGLGVSEHRLEPKSVSRVVLILLGLGIGLYNGAVGPGTGLLIVLALVRFLKLDFLSASAYGKVLNATADFGGVLSFLVQGDIVWKLSATILVGIVLGNILGSQLAMLRGSGFVKRMFVFVMLGLLCKMAWDIVRIM